ncbi:MAG: prepilin-type N-terminal cleavage/methylation domain-containing protein, partial [Oscillospiraceae bacterium]
MIQKIKSKKGFTLAELLIVIAIIGVLVAIAIPVFSAQLTRANKAVTDANTRSALAEATVDYLEDEVLTKKEYKYDGDTNTYTAAIVEGKI